MDQNMDHGRTQSLPLQHKLSVSVPTAPGAHRLSVSGSPVRRKSSAAASDARRKSFVEAAEAAGIDKNTIILTVNLLILCALMAILYVLATSAMNVSSLSGKHRHPLGMFPEESIE